MVASGVARTATWLIRFFQLQFAVILAGALSYIVGRFRDFGVGGVPREVFPPEVSSVLAIPFTAFSILAVFFLGCTGKIIATFFFALVIRYLTSARLRRHNFHRLSGENPFRDASINIRTTRGIDAREDHNGDLVRLAAGLVLIQVILFFTTTLLSLFTITRCENTSANPPVSEKHSHFSFSRSSRGSGEERAVSSLKISEDVLGR